MFKKELPSNPNSPFAKKKINTDVVSNTPSVVHTATVEEIDIPVASTIPAMFKKELPSNPNSPFAKKKINTDVVSNTQSVVHTAIVEEIDIPDSIIVNVLNTEDITSEIPIVKKKLSFGKR